jgi:hypothetical protein
MATDDEIKVLVTADMANCSLADRHAGSAPKAYAAAMYCKGCGPV